MLIILRISHSNYAKCYCLLSLYLASKNGQITC